VAPPVAFEQAVARYWRTLSRGGRELYGAAARIEQKQGVGYTFEDIASNLGITYSSTLALYRNSCRTAAVWVRDSRETEAPIHMQEIGYRPRAGGGRRTRYQLPPAVGDLVADLQVDYGEGDDA
jgi:hypothetical protein